MLLLACYNLDFVVYIRGSLKRFDSVSLLGGFKTMAQKSHGSRHGTRHKFARDSDQTLTVNDHMKEFDEGEKVLIKFHPSVQKGRIQSRYHGRTAEVTGSRGDAVELSVKDGEKEKTVYLKSVHLKEIDGGE
jgi:ribosomal protein L21E